MFQPAVRPAEEVQAEGGGARGHPGTRGPSALASPQGSSWFPDDSTLDVQLDVQLGDQQAEPALSPSGPELAACT